MRIDPLSKACSYFFGMLMERPWVLAAVIAGGTFLATTVLLDSSNTSAETPSKTSAEAPARAVESHRDAAWNSEPESDRYREARPDSHEPYAPTRRGRPPRLKRGVLLGDLMEALLRPDTELALLSTRDEERKFERLRSVARRSRGQGLSLSFLGESRDHERRYEITFDGSDPVFVIRLYRMDGRWYVVGLDQPDES